MTRAMNGEQHDSVRMIRAAIVRINGSQRRQQRIADYQNGGLTLTA
jgi:hypothetical protein